MGVLAACMTVLAVALCYSASSHQRWLRTPLPTFPARASAALAAVVAFTAWLQVLTFASAVFALLTTAMLAALAVSSSAVVTRS